MPTSNTSLLPPAQRRFVAIGLAIRLLKLLPPRVLHKLFTNAVGSGAAPRVPDLVLMLETAGALPSFGPSDEMLFAHDPDLATVTVTEPVIAGRAGVVPARLYRRADAPAAAALVWVHGGAFLGGDLAGAEAHWVGLAMAARGFPVLSLTYRMALHGSRFPDASDDVLSGWNWAVDHAEQLGVPADRLHLGGASAGGNLTAGVAKRLRDGAGRVPASVLLAYPLLHPEIPTWDPEELRVLDGVDIPVFQDEWIRDLSLHYVGSKEGLSDPYAFAANGDLSGLPPTLVFTNELDSLRSSGEAYARQLEEAGVEVKLSMVAGAAHGSLSDPLLPGGPTSIALMADWLSSRASA